MIRRKSQTVSRSRRMTRSLPFGGERICFRWPSALASGNDDHRSLRRAARSNQRCPTKVVATNRALRAEDYEYPIDCVSRALPEFHSELRTNGNFNRFTTRSEIDERTNQNSRRCLAEAGSTGRRQNRAERFSEGKARA